MKTDDAHDRGDGAEEPAGSLERILGEYLDRLNSGQTLDPREVLAEHPREGPAILKSLEEFVGLGSGVGAPPTLRALGDYQIRREIGRGGMGIVYEAWQSSMDRRVALKVLPPGIAADEKAFHRFLREAKAAGRLHHTSIVSVYGMGVESNTPYYAMEYVDGPTLASTLESLRALDSGASRRLPFLPGDLELQAKSPTLPAEGTGSVLPAESRLPGEAGPARGAGLPAKAASEPGQGPPPPDDAKAREARERDIIYFAQIAKAFADVADALQHAHSHGVIHRDIKPSNLILEAAAEASALPVASRPLTAGFTLRILDFGLARLEDQESLTASGDFLGTVLYMSPEQAMARRIPVDHRTDIYSLGATLYEALTLRPPFQGKNAQATLSEILFRDPPWPRKRNPRIPRDLETIVLKCLRKDPRDRYGTAEALAQDLRRFLRGDPIEARPQPVWERASRRAWRNRGKVAAACLVGLLLLTSALLLHRQRQDARAERLALYREKVFTAIGKMGLGRPGSARRARSAQEVPSAVPAPEERSGSEGGLLSVAHAEAEFAEALPDPVEEARDALRQAVDLFPERPEAHFYRTRAEELLGNQEEALRARERVLSCDPGFLPLLVARESASGKPEEEAAAGVDKALAGSVRPELFRDSLAAYRARAKGDWNEAAEALGRVLSQFSGDPELSEPYLGFRMQTLYDRGIARLKAEDLDGALEDFATVRGLWPQLVEPVLLLGATYFRKGDPARAEARFEEFFAATRRKAEFAVDVAELCLELEAHDRGLVWAEKAVKLDPSLVDARNGLGAVLRRQRRLDEAVAAFREAVRLDPESAVSHNNLGSALREQGKFDEALAEYRRVIELDPKSARVHCSLGVLFVRQGKLEEAIAAYREAIRIYPEYEAAHHYLGRALVAQGKLEEGIAEYGRAIELVPRSAPLRSDLGSALVDQGKLEDGIAECRRAIELDPKASYAYNGLGNALQTQGKLDEAIVEYRRAIELDPKASYPHNGLGNALGTQRKIEEAIAEFQKAIELDPKWSIPHNNLGNAFCTQGKLDDAIAEYRKAIELDPKSANARTGLGDVLLRQGKIDEAIAEYAKALELDPKNGAAHTGLGNVYHDQGKLVEAIAEFQKAIELNPKEGIPHNNLGNVLCDMGRLDEAVADYRKAIELGPKYANAHNGLGIALHDLGRLDEAIAEFRKAIELDPKESAPHNGLGDVLRDLGQLDDAMREYRHALELAPKSGAAHTGLGTVYRNQGKLVEAIAEYRKAIELDPKSSAPHNGLGILLHERGELDEAIAEFRKAIELDPGAGPAHNGLGLVLRSQGKLDEAVAELRKAIELKPKNGFLHSNLGLALRDQGRLDDAIAEFRRAIELDPKLSEAHGLLAAALRAQGRIEEALETLRKAIDLNSKDSALHTGLGNVLCDLGQLDEAVAEFRKILEIDPKARGARTGLAQVLSEQGKLDEAVAEFRRAIEIDPGDTYARSNLGVALCNQGKLEEGVAECRRAIELDPKSSGLHSNLGKLLCDRGRFEEAAAECRRAIELDPKDGAPHTLLGNALLGQGKIEEAFAEYSRASELDPKYADAHNGLGNALYRQGKIEEAIAAYRRAIELEPRYSTPHHNLGNVFCGQGKFAEAIAEFRRAIEIDPKYADAHTGLGTVFLRQGKLDEAVAELRKAVELDPRDAGVRDNLGVALGNQGKLDEAMAEHRRAIELDPRQAGPHVNLSSVLLHEDKLDEAIAECREAIRIDPKLWQAHAILGHVLRAQGKVEEAIAEFRAAILLDPKVAEVHTDMARALIGQGRPDEAIAELRKAVEIDPKDSDAHAFLGILIQGQGKLDEAIAEYREAVRLGCSNPVWMHRQLASLLQKKGQTAEALSEAGQALEAGDRDFGLALELLRSKDGSWKEGADLGPALERLIGALEKVVEGGPPPRSGAPEPPPGAASPPPAGEGPPPGALQALALALLLPSPRRDPEKAIRYAERYAAAAGEARPDCLSFLGEVRFRGGRTAGAVATFERLVSLHGATPERRAKLEEYRTAALPDLPTFGSIDAALERPEAAALIGKGVRWRFFRGKTEPSGGLEWTQVDFEDSGWEVGPSGFGYGDDDDATVLDDMKDGYTTAYLRHTFEVPDPGGFVSMTLHVVVDDGCVVYLNGAEACRVRAGGAGSRLARDAVASENAPEPAEWTELPLDLALLRRGKNVLAIQVLNFTVDSSDLTLIPEVRAELSPHHDHAMRWARAGRALEVIGSEAARSALDALLRGSPAAAGLPPPERITRTDEVNRSGEIKLPEEVPGPEGITGRKGIPRPEGTGAAETTDVRDPDRPADGVPQSKAMPGAPQPASPGGSPWTYGQDFEAEVGAEWSSQKTDATPAGGRKFLGEFGNDRLTLSLEGLPEHRVVRISFQLYLVRSWDGNMTPIGPDLFEVAVGDGRNLLETTFNAGFGAGPFRYSQAYPDVYGWGEHPVRLGASEVNTLGYTFGGGGTPLDAVYALSFAFPHTAGRLKVHFGASGLSGLEDESWGIDNVLVEALPGPEPLSAEEKARLWEDLGARDAIAASAALWRIVAAGDGGAAYIGERLEATKAERESARREMLEFESRRFDGFRAVAAGKGAEGSGLLAYLEGRLLERGGEHREAAAQFEKALSIEGSAPEPWLRLAACLRALGQPGEAEERLREALRGGVVADSRDAWDSWWAAAAEAKLPTEEMRKLLSEVSSARPGSYAADLLWALEGLSRDGAIRIHCGGEELRGTDAKLWGKDRFALGGNVFAGPSGRSVEGTEDDGLYLTERWFPSAGVGPAGYRIPLLAGRYKVTLGFAEVSFRDPGWRRFDVRLEGKTVLEDYEPKVDTAEDFSFETEVGDGHLDLGFVPRRDNTKISSIAIERIR